MRTGRLIVPATGLLMALAVSTIATPARPDELSQPSGARPAQPPSRPTVRIDARRSVGTLSAQLTGANNDTYWDNSKGLWDPNSQAPTADSLAKIRRANVGMIWFPGGTGSLEFDWTFPAHSSTVITLDPVR